MCGIGALISLVPFRLETLMNIPLNQLYRGTKGCGIAWTDFRSIYLIKDPISPKAFKNKYELVLKTVTAKMAIIHHRLPSHGDVKYENTHPFMSCRKSPIKFAFCHNGTFPSILEFREELEAKGHRIGGETDSELIMHMIEDEIGSEEDLLEVMKKYGGAGVLVALTTKAIYVVSGGTRSIYLAKTPRSIIVASTIKAIYETAKTAKETPIRYYSIRHCKISFSGSSIVVKGSLIPVEAVVKPRPFPSFSPPNWRWLP